MTKYFYILIICLALNSCVNENSTQTKTNPDQEVNHNTNPLQDNFYTTKWLTKVITDYVNSEDLKSADKNLQEVLTSDYYNYKMDAITLEYSDMTYEDFQSKWKSKYDTKYVGSGGFFTSVMDNGNVAVTLCELLYTYGDSAKVFRTVVHDNRWNTNYKFDIKIISKDNKLLIDDVREHKQDN